MSETGSAAISRRFPVNASTGQLTSLGVQPSNTLGTPGAINGIAYIPQIIVDNFDHPRADFDGDFRTDLSVFRPSEGNWYLQQFDRRIYGV